MAFVPTGQVADTLAAGDDPRFGTTEEYVADLERRFRLLFRDYYLTFGRIPPGLEDELEQALNQT